MSHSKRNTSRAVFTSYERELARKSWASTSARLNRESFLPFSACRLCLESAIDPVSCTHGDIFCRECALSNILAQKKEIKRLEKLKGQEEREAKEHQSQLDAEAHERAVREFEMTQHGLDVRSRTAPSSKPTSDGHDRQESSTTEAEAGQGAGARKRKFEIDEDEIQRIAADDRARARKDIDDEKAARPTLPSFWVPTVTPSSNTRDTLHDVVKKTKTSPICPASPEDKPHTYSLHALVKIHFTTEDDDNGKSKNGKAARICPACKKGLGNSSKAMLAKPCGHVLCGGCVEKFMKPNKHNDDPHASGPGALRCYVCDTDLTNSGVRGHDRNHEGKKKEKEKDKIRPGLVELRSEGTGYSAGGANEVRRNGVAAFQC
ncbi:putative zinc finger containing protein [Rosellinia necatrix]|uniref:Putative zinc finger containing protein n=1 Tax=Rosellinia necatrix TaxID=77044 RepID=A0A1W2TNP4_ROSNE|nr:putative zinc finger containing protein [Rosellinia necatrix]